MQELDGGLGHGSLIVLHYYETAWRCVQQQSQAAKNGGGCLEVVVVVVGWSRFEVSHEGLAFTE
jgi:hypothetical protein